MLQLRTRDLIDVSNDGRINFSGNRYFNNTVRAQGINTGFLQGNGIGCVDM